MNPSLLEADRQLPHAVWTDGTWIHRKGQHCWLKTFFEQKTYNVWFMVQTPYKNPACTPDTFDCNTVCTVCTHILCPGINFASLGIATEVKSYSNRNTFMKSFTNFRLLQINCFENLKFIKFLQRQIFRCFLQHKFWIFAYKFKQLIWSSTLQYWVLFCNVLHWLITFNPSTKYQKNCIIKSRW